MAIRRGRKAGTFVVEFQQGGARVYRRLPEGITRSQAQAFETKLRREAFDGVLGRREVTIAEAIGQWISTNPRKNQRQAESEARQWEPWAGRLLREAPEVAQEAVSMWGHARSTNATGAAIRQHAARTAASQQNEWPAGSGGSKLNASGAQPASAEHATKRASASTRPSPATINRRLALLKACLKHAWKQGLIPENLSGRITLLREDNKREVYLTREEVMTLARSAPTSKGTAAIMIAAYSGLRASELIVLPKLNTRSAMLPVPTSKTGKSRLVPLASPARSYLRELPLGLSYWQLHKEFLRARKAAKMPHVKFHDLRHTCASWLINAGVPLEVVGKILGHTTLQTTMRYSHLSTATLEKAMSKLK